MENERVREARPRPPRWTYAEFARLPSEGGVRHEIIAGELVVTPSPSPAHQRVVTRLITALHHYVADHGLGEVFAGPIDVLFAEGDYLAPDLVFVRAGRDHVVSDRGLEEAPDLVVEVVSPSTKDRDGGVKLERYGRFGVPEYWIVDPDAGTLHVWRLAAGATEPEVLRAGDVLRWEPVAEASAGGHDGPPPMEADVATLLGG
jgi:Uma2 family endonuclease